MAVKRYVPKEPRKGLRSSTFKTFIKRYACESGVAFCKARDFKLERILKDSEEYRQTSYQSAMGGIMSTVWNRLSPNVDDDNPLYAASRERRDAESRKDFALARTITRQILKHIKVTTT